MVAAGLSVGVKAVSGIQTLKPEPFIAAKEAAAWKKASSKAIDLLQRLGPDIAAHGEVYDPDGRVSADML